MKKYLKYFGYGFMFLGGFFLPLYVYASILILYWLIDSGVYFFRVRENGKGILCMVGSIIIILFVYFKFITDILYKGLSSMDLTIF